MLTSSCTRSLMICNAATSASRQPRIWQGALRFGSRRYLHRITNVGQEGAQRTRSTSLCRRQTPSFPHSHLARCGAANGVNYHTPWRSIVTLFSAICSPRVHCARSLAGQVLSESEYDDLADETLHALCDYLDTFPEWLKVDADFDVGYAMGVLTINLGAGQGTYVINKQTPNKQIWLSSPFSGPKRYDFVEGQWTYMHDGKTITKLLNEEFRRLYNDQSIDFTECKH